MTNISRKERMERRKRKAEKILKNKESILTKHLIKEKV